MARLKEVARDWLLLGAARLGWMVIELGARVPGARHWRFVALPRWCKRAADQGDHQRAAALARELLALAPRFANDWNYGNALHHGHLVLGRIALARGDTETARAELLEAGRTPGSPQLDSFGPNMRLARDLAGEGEWAVVRQYLALCRKFWKMGGERLDRWEKDVAEARVPDFGPNLAY